MRINRVEKSQAEKLVKTALELGAYFFDHADVYGDGACEELFAELTGMNPSVREKLLIQTKCGIRRKVAFDFSK
jgi:predicted oxidoreductase